MRDKALKAKFVSAHECECLVKNWLVRPTQEKEDSV